MHERQEVLQGVNSSPPLRQMARESLPFSFRVILKVICGWRVLTSRLQPDRRVNVIVVELGVVVTLWDADEEVNCIPIIFTGGKDVTQNDEASHVAIGYQLVVVALLLQIRFILFKQLHDMPPD